MSKNRKRNKGPRRSYLKAYSQTYMGSMVSPRKETIKELHRSAAGLSDPLFKATKPEEAADGYHTVDPFISLRPWKGGLRHHGFDEIHEVRLVFHPRKTIYLCFSGKSYWFKKVDTIFQKEEFSLSFGSKEVAMSFYNQGAVVYNYTVRPEL